MEKVNPEGQILYELSCKKSVCYRIISKYKEAIEGAKQVLKTFTLREDEDLSWFIELKNDIASAYNDWGKFLREKGNYEEAIEKHREAIKIFEKNIKKLNEKLNNGSISGSKRILVLLDKAQVHENLGSTYFDLYKTTYKSKKKKKKISRKYLIALRRIIKKRLRSEKNFRILSEEKCCYIITTNFDILMLGKELKHYNNLKLGDLYNNLFKLYFFIAERYNS